MYRVDRKSSYIENPQKGTFSVVKEKSVLYNIFEHTFTNMHTKFQSIWLPLAGMTARRRYRTSSHAGWMTSAERSSHATSMEAIRAATLEWCLWHAFLSRFP